MSGDKAKAMIEAAAQRAAQYLIDDYEVAAERCDSPIERIIVAQYLDPDFGLEWDLLRRDILYPPSGSIDHVQPPPLDGIFLWPQIKIGPYRVDFIFGTFSRRHDEYRYVIVECDGHAFHEKTKEQAQRDKARDRYIVARGHQILRFTGSEIFRDPRKVLNEIVEALFETHG